ncbi:MAG TPA: helicase-related protein [Coleofasciculaceae cyanobacterium]|jgi:superfamily II DNA or RNA helicase
MATLLPGTEVQARGLRWEVVNSDQLGQQTLYRLRCLEGDFRGDELDLLTPFELVEPVVHDLQPERATPLRNWLVYHQAFLLEQALGADVLLAVQPGRLRLEPYQLVPVLRSLKMGRVRLLLADGVGLGKTIQAGLILTELIARRVAHRILVVSPAGPLLDQWQLEMTERFGLRMDVIDRAKLEEIRRKTELGANPFDHIPLGLVSIDFLKQERVLDLLERASYDVVVLDEAHHCMDLGSAEREDSQRRRLAEVLARRSDALLMLTATPHDGNDRSFASLCELLDPSLVDGKGMLRGDRYRSHVVRRLKNHIPGKFKERQVLPCPVPQEQLLHPSFVELQRQLLELIAPRLKRAFKKREYSEVLSLIALLKRSVSTVSACKLTLERISKRRQELLTERSEEQQVRKQRINTLRDYQRKLERFGTLSFEEEQEKGLLEVEDIARQLLDIQREVRSSSSEIRRASEQVDALDQLIVLAEAAADHDPKLQQLCLEVEAIRQEKPNTNVLIFTEYTDSQEVVVRSLRQANLGEVIMMSGDNSEKERRETTDRFQNQNRLILVSTDTAAEGLNLQQQCHHLIHLELPFNPNRLEQRNGRIDRFGQMFDPIVRYLYLKRTFEERILLRLIAKYERQRQRLTFVPNTLGLTATTDTSTERLLKGLMEEDEHLFQDNSQTFDFTSGNENEGTDEATRELLEEIDQSLKGFEQAARTHTWLGDAGMNAQKQLLTEADQAHDLGERVNCVDLVSFVQNAVLMDGGDVREPTDEIFEIQLPPAWNYGLDELPGYDATQRILRLTTNLEITRDAGNNPVGFLGRAHPLVRRALDRVRNLSFGGTAQMGQDPRVSAVKADVVEPVLLLTYLGRVSSGAGRELERVLAVKTTQTGEAAFFAQADQWLSFADRQRAINPRDIWQQHFAEWGAFAKAIAQEAAVTGFQPIAQGFIQERRQDLQKEQSRQIEWLQQRSQEITGSQVEQAVQFSLFDSTVSSDSATLSSFGWMAMTDPVERLAAFATDGNQPSRARSEADGVLRIYRQRSKGLAEQLSLGAPEILPLGILMLIPEV